MDALLGFAVLTGPLWLILLLFPLSIWIAVKVSRRYAPGQFRILAGIVIFLFVLLLPFADEITGRFYFNYLCATQAGVKVYQTVELPAEYWDERGVARFYREFDSLLGKTYSSKYTPGTYSSLFHIDNAGLAYLHKQSGQVLGEAIDFGHWGGWIRRNLTPHNSATGCLDYSIPSNRLIDLIFIPENARSRKASTTESEGVSQ